MTKEEYIELLDEFDKSNEKQKILDEFSEKARNLRDSVYGNKVYIRGLIEFTNYCKNNCHYCGIQRENKAVVRYRLSEEEILKSCKYGYNLGFRTFVLQGGEDVYFTDDRLIHIVRRIKENYADCAITLSVGERTAKSYRCLRDVGVDRYLLRHETADKKLYRKLHPKELSLSNRMNCLRIMKDMGFQTGAGFMVGSPGQTNESIAKDLVYLKKLSPQMVGIGPFIPHKDTIFANEKKGDVDKTLLLLSIVRIMLPHVLLPATTALSTADSDGRVKGLLAGANVVMPNLSPISVREKYMLYNDKVSMEEEAAEGLEKLEIQVKSIGMSLDLSRGDYK